MKKIILILVFFGLHNNSVFSQDIFEYKEDVQEITQCIEIDEVTLECTKEETFVLRTIKKVKNLPFDINEREKRDAANRVIADLEQEIELISKSDFSKEAKVGYILKVKEKIEKIKKPKKAKKPKN